MGNNTLTLLTVEMLNHPLYCITSPFIKKVVLISVHVTNTFPVSASNPALRASIKNDLNPLTI
ncbi:MAG: hypothetical protein P0116_02690 [Candidatus Nitrosocosmicus sp.]|nr:hypothetical protein [Candidatus Nitrosocosmicus sp.]